MLMEKQIILVENNVTLFLYKDFLFSLTSQLSFLETGSWKLPQFQ